MRKVSEIVCINFTEVNIKDYPREEMHILCAAYTPDRVKRLSERANMYVAHFNNEIVGCGTIHSFWGKEDESILRTIFVQPEFQGTGIGKKIMLALENDEQFLRVKRVEIPASITSYKFYMNFGYEYLNSIIEVDDEGHYRLEKYSNHNNEK